MAGPPQIQEIVSNLKRPMPPQLRAPMMARDREILSRIMIYYVPFFFYWMMWRNGKEVTSEYSVDRIARDYLLYVKIAGGI